MKSKYFKFTTRNGSEVSKRFIVQATDYEEAREIVNLTVLAEDEEIMTSRDITSKIGEKETLQSFVDRIHDAEFLVCTGGIYPTTIKSSK